MLYIKNDAKGFTMVEIMIAIAIIGLLSGIAIPNILIAKETAGTNSCRANMRQISSALEMTAMLDGTAIDNLNEAAIQAAAVPDYLKSMPDCPYGTYSTDANEDVLCSLAAHNP